MSEHPSLGQNEGPVCPDCGTELTPVKGRRSGKRFLWCWKCERSLRSGEARSARLNAAPDPAPIDETGLGYGEGWVGFLADSSKPPLRLSIGVQYGEDDPGTDIVISSWGVIEKHPYGHVPRESTEEERAAVGWTW